MSEYPDQKTNLGASDVHDRIDPDIKAPLSEVPPVMKLVTREVVDDIRSIDNPKLKAQGVEGISKSEHRFNTSEGEVSVLIFRPAESANMRRPALLWMHGGGYLFGSADSRLAEIFAEALSIIVVSVEYRLAPEHPFPAGHNDSYNTFRWMVDNADRLGIDKDRIAIGGNSAGAGLAAGLTLRNRDESGPHIAFQLLLYPMLDNLHTLPSSTIEDYPIWNRQTSLNAWEMYLNGTPGEEAPPYAAAARAKDLSGLPQAYITTGEIDLLCDEVVSYAQRLMAEGVKTELAVFPGMYHGAEVLVPHAKISQQMTQGYVNALKEALCLV